MPRLRLKRRADEYLKTLPTHVQEELDAALLAIAADPRGEGQELQGRLRGLWRKRVGGYRILYRLENSDRLVIVDSIRLRRTSYPPRRGAMG